MSDLTDLQQHIEGMAAKLAAAQQAELALQEKLGQAVTLRKQKVAELAAASEVEQAAQEALGKAAAHRQGVEAAQQELHDGTAQLQALVDRLKQLAQ